MPLTFGIFDHIDKQTFQPLSGTYEDRLRVLELADKAGFHSFHLAEHHATPLCMAPQPSVFLGALTQRTTKLRLGPLVYLLPLYHPIRLIEEICMLDHLSNGRLDLGVGRGVSPIELGYMGVNAEESRQRFEEQLEILTQGLQSKRLTYNGHFHKLQDVPIEFEPVQKPLPPIWYPTSALDRVAFVAQHSFNTVLLGGIDRVKQGIDRYWEVWHEHHAEREPRPLVGAQRTVVLADSDDEALNLARPNFRQHYDSLVKLWREHGMNTATETFTPDIDEEIRDHKAFVGTPATVTQQLAEFAEGSTCEYIVIRPMFGDLRREQLEYSMGLFINEVMPAFSGTPSAATV